jgi:alpha-amylase
MTAAVLGFVLAVPEGLVASPEDWRDQTIYQIVTDRFFDGDPSNNSIEGFFDPNDGARIHGGDFAGVEAKLDYIEALGATAIWISPVQRNAFAAYHGYHIQNFYEIAPHFGGMTDLLAFIDAAHARGLFVILDVVANHGGDLIDSGSAGYPAFVNPGTYTLRWRNAGNQAAPPFQNLSWYHNNGHIDDFVDPNQLLGELFGLDDFKTEEPSVRQALIDAHEWLIGETGADGFRIDTVKHVELSFWQEFGPSLRAFAADSLAKGNVFLYGEVFDGDPAKTGIYTGTQGGGAFALDSVLWFPMYFVSSSVFRDGAPTALLSSVYGDSLLYDPAARNRLVSFLDNHDVARFQAFQSNAERDDSKARTALAWQLTSLGVPVVYYGTEQEFDGGGDPYNREDMFEGAWDFGPSEGDNFDMTSPLFGSIRRLNELRAQFPALRRGAQSELAASATAGIYAYRRTLAGEEPLAVVLNTGPSADTLSFEPGLGIGTIHDAMTGRTFSAPPSGPVGLVVGGFSAAVLVGEAPSFRPWVLETWPAHDGRLFALDAEIRITFTEAMDPSATEAEVSIDPTISFTSAWAGRTLILRPAANLANMTRYTVTVAGGARSAVSGMSMGGDFEFFFETATGAGSVSVPAGYYATVLPNGDLRTPLSLERGSGRTLATNRVWLGDTGWDRVFFAHDRGFLEARFVDGSIARPSSLAQDLSDGQFQGDLLLADGDRLRRLHLDGLDDGRVSVLVALPAFALDWALALDPSGSYGGLAYAGRSGAGTVHATGPSGPLTTFATGLPSVRGLAFAPAGDFGAKLYAASNGQILRIEPNGSGATFASSALLNGAAALAFDPVGNFGGDLFAANLSTQSILRVTEMGAVSTFATGFASLTGPDCLAFDELGDLYAVESGSSGTPRIVKIVPRRTSFVATDVPPVERALVVVGPNPFRERVGLRFALGGEEEQARLTIYDVAGRLVTELQAGADPGARVVFWEGDDARGREAPAGVYFARLVAGSRRETVRLVLVR